MDYKLTDEEIMEDYCDSCDLLEGCISTDQKETCEIYIKILRERTKVLDAQLSKLLKPHEGLAEEIKGELESLIMRISSGCEEDCPYIAFDPEDVMITVNTILPLIASECLQAEKKARKELIKWLLESCDNREHETDKAIPNRINCDICMQSLKGEADHDK